MVLGTKKQKISQNKAAIPLHSAIGLGMAVKVTASNKVSAIDSLTYAKLGAGSLVLGYVLHVTERNEVVVSLPGGLTGTVSANEVSDAHFSFLGASTGLSSGNKVFRAVVQPLLCEQVIHACFLN